MVSTSMLSEYRPEGRLQPICRMKPVSWGFTKNIKTAYFFMALWTQPLQWSKPCEERAQQLCIWPTPRECLCSSLPHFDHALCYRELKGQKDLRSRLDSNIRSRREQCLRLTNHGTSLLVTKDFILVFKWFSIFFWSSSIISRWKGGCFESDAGEK